MNFLSHFYHEMPCDDPYFTCGVILPDMLSNYSARNREVVKLHPNKLKESMRPDFNSLNAGVKEHYAVDAFFHESDFFSINTKMISAVVREYDFSCFERRLFAFSHVMLELMLDRKILKEDITICDRFYGLLDMVDKQAFAAFIENNTKTQNTEKLEEHLHRFRSLRFVYDYVNDGVLINILDHINRQLGNHVFSATDKNYITSVIHKTEHALISQKFPKFKTHL